MLSIKKYLESDAEELVRSAISSYRSTLQAMANNGIQACPPVGLELQQSLLNLQERLALEATAQLVNQTGQQASQELEAWSGRAAEYFKHQTEEFRDIMLIMATTAQSVGDRDQRYLGQLGDFTTRLQSFASLDDLAQIKTSIKKSASELQSCVAQMARDGQEAVAKLQRELAIHQAKLDEAERIASADALTGVANRRRVEQEMESRAAVGREFAIVLFDLNRFKPINDTFGHQAGDAVLKQFATELKQAFRSTDLVGRWGGDEFIAILDGKADQAEPQLERVRKWVFGEYTIQASGKEQKVFVDASIGVAGWSKGEAITLVIEQADKAMYVQKGKKAR